jgi:chromosome segregation ATPase
MNDTTRKNFIDTLKGRLDDLDGHIARLEQKGKEFEGEARKEYEKRLQDLREKRRHVDRKIQELRAAGEEKWQALKDEAEHTWKALSNSFSYFKSHFK